MDPFDDVITDKLSRSRQLRSGPRMALDPGQFCRMVKIQTRLSSVCHLVEFE
ncbi:hypothetical protein OROMI_014952 [Orobanche minor]